jgi:DNA mismatch repair protein MSH6
MSHMITELLDAAEGFASSSVAGLLRTAPDLDPMVAHIDSLYHSPESGKPRLYLMCLKLTG